MMTTIAYKKPNFAVSKGNKNDLVPRVSFGGTFFKEEEVDEEVSFSIHF